MAATITLNVYAGEKGFNPLPRKREFFGSAVIGSGTYVTGGLPLTWNLLDYLGNPIMMPRANTPDVASFYSLSTPGNVYMYSVNAGSLRIIVNNTELANGATIPAAVTGDTIEFDGVFQKLWV